MIVPEDVEVSVPRETGLEKEPEAFDNSAVNTLPPVNEPPIVKSKVILLDPAHTVFPVIPVKVPNEIVLAVRIEPWLPITKYSELVEGNETPETVVVNGVGVLIVMLAEAIERVEPPLVTAKSLVLEVEKELAMFPVLN